MNNRLTLITSIALAIGASGCTLGGECGPRGSELFADIDRLDATTRTYTLTRDDGVLSVEVMFDRVGPHGPVATRSVGVQVMAFVSDLFVPSVFATDCLMPEANADLTYSATWTPTGGEPELLREGASGQGVYAYGVRSGGAYLSNATELVIEGGEHVTIVLVSLDGDARTLELVQYTDWEENRGFTTTVGCPEGVNVCVDAEQRASM